MNPTLDVHESIVNVVLVVVLPDVGHVVDANFIFLLLFLLLSPLSDPGGHLQ